MAKMKYYNGSSWVTLDAANGDTVDGLHFRINGGKLQYSQNGSTWYDAGLDTSDATALAQHILSGETAYVNGVKITGTMPNKTGGYTTDSLTRSGNELRMSIDSPGYFSDSAYLRYTDNDWIESNIRKNVNIFGKIGTLEEGDYSIGDNITGADLSLQVAYQDTLASRTITGQSGSMAVDRNTGDIYLRRYSDYYLRKLDKNTLNDVSSINIGSSFTILGVNPVNHYVYVAVGGSPYGIRIYNSSLNLVNTISSVRVSSDRYHVCPVTGRLVVSDSGDSNKIKLYSTSASLLCSFSPSHCYSSGLQTVGYDPVRDNVLYSTTYMPGSINRAYTIAYSAGSDSEAWYRSTTIDDDYPSYYGVLCFYHPEQDVIIQAWADYPNGNALFKKMSPSDGSTIGSTVSKDCYGSYDVDFDVMGHWRDKVVVAGDNFSAPGPLPVLLESDFSGSPGANDFGVPYGPRFGVYDNFVYHYASNSGDGTIVKQALTDIYQIAS
jgi:hypothetical protein